MSRLYHVVGIDGVPPRKQCVVIVDESDDVVMKDPENFAKKMMAINKLVVCLTATPDDGTEEGSERKLMTMMGFKTIFAGEKHEFIEPKITIRATIKTASDIVEQVKHF